MLDVPPIGMGTGFSDVELKHPDKIVTALQYGIEQGLRFIDTAENYGGGFVEELVGKAIAGRRGMVFVASKFSPDHSTYEQVIAACKGSLRRLKTDYLDLYQTHWPNPRVPFGETLQALLDLQKQGKVRALGMSNVASTEVNPPFQSLQIEYNLFERTIEYDGTLEYCSRNKISLIAYSPLDQGRAGHTLPPQLQLAWLMSHPSVIAIPKSLNPHHIKANVEAMCMVLKPEDKARIDREFFQEISYIPTDQISVAVDGERDRAVYTTLNEARENRFGYVPSPAELAGTMEAGGFVKPVRLVPGPAGRYQLINGRIRYWAWVIAFGGEKPIPAYIRHDLKARW